MNEWKIDLHSLKIKVLESKLEEMEDYNYPEGATEELTMFVEWMKLKYTIKNYLDCIMRHEEENGKVYLRDVDGTLMMPNKQPLPYSPDITKAIIARNGV